MPATASNERICCRLLLSKIWKSCCCRSETGFPDLSFTTTLSLIRLPTSESAVALMGDETAAARVLGLKVPDTVRLWLWPKDE